MTTLGFIFGMTLFFAQDTAYTALEKKAVATVQQVMVSQLDSQLPDRSFSSWFNQIVGAQSGVNWQLTDCGEQTGNAADRERDMPYCVEIVAITPNGRKAFVNVRVGSVKRGVDDKPQLYFAVVEHKGEFYKAARLSELPGLLTNPLKPKPKPVVLPDTKSKKQTVLFSAAIRSEPVAVVKAPSVVGEVQPPPPLANRATKTTIVALGEVVTKVSPEYPVTARQVGASGEVRVQITVSEQGRVLQAKAISGHALLRRPAEVAASKWIFKPAMLDGKPVKAEGSVSFIFTRD